ncbi:hypothetical protein D3C73_928360 [compost metagenome]
MPSQNSNDGWSKLTKVIVGLTGVLVVVPSLINSAKNIYDEVNKVPRTDAERVNVEFFKKYWGKKPVGELPLLISRGGVNYQVSFNIYDEGDVYIQYGNMIQWFAFPGPANQPLAASGGLISTAYADEIKYRALDSEYRQFKQVDTFEGGNAIREKFYVNGMSERQVIDVRTGMVIDQKVNQLPVPTEINIPQSNQGVKIDLSSPDPKFELFH